MHRGTRVADEEKFDNKDEISVDLPDINGNNFNGHLRRQSDISDFSLSIEGLPSFEIEIDGGGGSDSDREYSSGKSGKWGAVFNFTNTIIGAGVIGLPFALNQCGLVAGMLLIVLAAYFTERSSVMLVLSGERLKRLNYEEAMEASFGAAGYFVFCFFALVMAFGAMCAYLIIIGDTIPEIITHSDVTTLTPQREMVVAIFSTLVLLPLSCLRDMHNLSFSSLLSVLADALIIVLLLFVAPGAAADANDGAGIDRSNVVNVIKPTVFAGFGAITFAFVSQSSTFLLYRSLEKRSLPLWISVTRWAVGSAFVIASLMALVGYLNFAGDTQADVLNNLPSDSPGGNAARGFLAVSMVFTYPLEMFVARHVLDASIFQKLWGRGRTTAPRHYFWTLLLWALTTAVALATDNLGAVLEIFGAFSASAIGYVLPSVLYLHAYREEVRESLDSWRRDSERYLPTLCQRLGALKGFYTPAFMTVFGIVAMFAGVTTTIYDENH